MAAAKTRHFSLWGEKERKGERRTGKARVTERERERRRLHFLFPGETTPLSAASDTIRQDTATLSLDHVFTDMFQL